MFSETLSAMMVEEGFDYDRYAVEEIRYMVRSCMDEAFAPCWDEFMEWIAHGDAARARTMAELRSSLRTPAYRPRRRIL